MKRDLEKARFAFKKRDKKLLRTSHGTHTEMHEGESGKYLKSWVYGGLDGIITTFAVVSGVIGAGLEASIILILGFANLIADGISMGVGDYLSTKSEREYYDLEKRRETWEVNNHPKGEIDEMIEVYEKNGFSKEDSKKMVKLLSKNKKFWVKTMMHEELGLMKENISPVKHGFVTFVSFLIFGLIPLSLYVFSAVFNVSISNGFLLTSAFAGVAMFVLGSAKTRFTGKNWIRSGLETLTIGGVAASAAYFVGVLLSNIV